MRLSRLRILGFKSFAQKVEFTFGPGITALVGPNGCGKTNVVEALRWVLGEQNPRVLRCGRMDDLVFSGSTSRRPLGLAEVAVNIEDEGSLLPGGAAELEVTRRLFKDGQSEFLINRQPVLLREIRDVFLDIGLGAEGYSLLERDMVDQVLKDPAGTRRLVLEQAAGIARYRDRSRRAMAKLEASHQDMLRLSDLLSEVKTQVVSLSRQAGKAARYRAWQDEIRSLNRSIVALERQRLSRLKQELERSTERSGRQRRKGMEQLQRCEQELREAHAARDALEGEIARRREETGGLDREREDLARQERYLSERLVEERLRATSARERGDRETARLAEAREESLILARKVAQLRSDVRGAAERTCELQQRLDQTRGKRSELASRVTRLESRARKERAKALSSQRERGRLTERKRFLGTEVRRLAERGDQTSLRLERLRSLKEETRSLQARCAEAMRGLEEKLDGVRSDLASEEERLAALASECSGLSSRVEFLAALQREGGTPLERFVGAQGVLGSLGSMVSVEPGREAEVNGALGGAVEWLVVRTWADAVRIAGEAAELPRAGILVMEEFARTVAGSDGVRSGSVAELVSAGKDVRDVVLHVLGSTGMAKDLSEARRMVGEEGWPRAVTQRGEVVEGSGLVMLGRLRALAGTGDTLEVEEENLARAKRQRLEAEERVRELRSQRDETARRLQEERTRELVATNDLRRFEREDEELTNALEKLRTERESLEREHADIIIEDKEEPLPDTAELDSLREQDRDLGAEEAQAARALAEATRAAAEAGGRIEGMIGELRRLASLRREARETAARAADEADRSRTRVDELAGELEESGARLGVLTEKLAPYREQTARLESGLQDARERAISLEAKRTSAWEKLEESRESLHEAEIEQARLTAMWDALGDRATRDIGCSLDDLSKPEVEGSVEELTARASELMTKTESLGSVNFAAEQEHARAKDRYDFLDAQLRDLTEARAGLEEAMARMKDTAKELFVATLDKVRENFKYTFGELFQGGEADLELVDEDDPLESGVEIVARPGGKRLRRIEVLSGGEKALTAIALLFAIYLVRPSPFCILDEVDAPLDDANVERFLVLLRNFASGSQFVIVTHNRRTMKAADALYGITMGEPGVSQVVSVRLPES
jgi:chromosome segregation protein